MAVFDEKWLKCRETISRRGIFMFNNDLLSDVSLVVRGSSEEGEPAAKRSKMAIPAHKVVLSICSPVFFAMFCGEMAERSDTVGLPDCEYEGVLEMLRFMYTDVANLNENNVTQVLYVAKKYMVNTLSSQCVLFLRKKLNPSNVFSILSHARQFDEKILVDQCWELIDRETEEAVKSQEFATIEWSLLEALVKRDTLTIREVELFKAVNLWATKECGRLGVPTTPDVKRQILGEGIVKQLRLPAMDQKDFASAVLDSEMLTQKEVINIVKHFNSVLKSPVGFLGSRRIGACQSCFRFNGIGCYTRIYPGEESIDFILDKDIVLHGICLFGRRYDDFEVTLTVKENRGGVNTVIVNKSGKFPSVLVHKKEFCYYGFNIMFNPVNLRKGCKYSAIAEIKGPRSCFGTNGVHQVTSHGVKFVFKSRGNSTTTAQCGQFADFLFKLP